MEDHIQAMETYLSETQGVRGVYPPQYGPTLRELLSIIEKWEKEPSGGYSFPIEVVTKYFSMCKRVEDPVLLAFIMDVKGRFAACSGEMILSIIKE